MENQNQLKRDDDFRVISNINLIPDCQIKSQLFHVNY